ncbi:hypothetical protein SAMN02745215_04049 [Desulfitobacterium chlororespirans DSM 11544]|uniref:Uncharacterized protein n=1 Tax=Desulfitobacterium chlororespirans DSM 11544 TaxID=1121395 RepID=A0A1M7UKQ1_9FIRM|nr:hypothetical protein SAMN02745215_04049 [Desulfitobacterium chlororespirans DSM 11544]
MIAGLPEGAQYIITETDYAQEKQTFFSIGEAGLIYTISLIRLVAQEIITP